MNSRRRISRRDIQGGGRHHRQAYPSELERHFEAHGGLLLGPVPCEAVEAPRVEEAGVSMECVLDRILPLGANHLSERWSASTSRTKVHTLRAIASSGTRVGQPSRGGTQPAS
jgi:hypothetical protein